MYYGWILFLKQVTKNNPAKYSEVGEQLVSAEVKVKSQQISEKSNNFKIANLTAEDRRIVVPTNVASGGNGGTRLPATAQSGQCQQQRNMVIMQRQVAAAAAAAAAAGGIRTATTGGPEKTRRYK